MYNYIWCIENYTIYSCTFLKHGYSGDAGNTAVTISTIRREASMFRENEIIGSYKIMYPIGQGGIGTIYLAYHLNLDKYVVLKEIMIKGMNAVDFRREATIMKNLRHTYLPNIYDFIMQPDRVITVMDYIPGKDFGKLPAGRNQLSENQLIKWLRQMAEVLSYLESRIPPVIHSDIKPENIILQPNGDICLIDFNISMIQNTTKAIYGYSRHFSSPEQMLILKQMSSENADNADDLVLDVRTDIYSTGATFYYLITGQYPGGVKPVIPLSEYKDLPYSDAFLAIIDKCMKWKRESRYLNAASLLKAIDNLKKQDKRYKKYVACNVLSWIGSALLIAGGLFMIFRGLGMKTNERFLREMSSLKYAVESGADAEAAALSILNNDSYRMLIENSPENEANFRTLMGDIYYRRQDYYSAAQEYEKALHAAERADLDLADYYDNLGVAYAYSERASEAQKVLEDAEGRNITSLALLQIQEAVYKMSGDETKCEQTAEEIINQTGDPGKMADACIVTADMYIDSGKYEKALEWLQKAESYSSRPEIQERMGRCYISWMNTVNSKSDKEKLAQKSLDCYLKIAGDRYVLTTDRINLAIVYRILGYYEQSNSELEQVLLQDEGNCTALMYMAVNAYDCEDDTNGNSYAKRASEKYFLLSPEERRSIDGQLVRELNVRASSRIDNWEDLK